MLLPILRLIVKAVRFLRALPSARLCTRELVRTLRLSWLAPNVVDCFDTWIQALLLLLPNLQSLYVNGLTCLDHKSVHSLKLLDGTSEHSLEFNLRLLEAQKAENLTPSALSELIPLFPRLVYLDLSGTASARDHVFISGLSHLHELKLLKINGIGLRDVDMEVLVHAIRRRVRLLDVSQNKLSDRGLQLLQKHCLRQADSSFLNLDDANGRHYEWSASGAPFSNVLTSASLRSERFEIDLQRQLSEPLSGRSSFGDIPWTGISHLIVGGNSISPGCLGGLVIGGGLCYLDIGSLTLPAGLLKHPGAKDLRFLRVHHSAVTANFQGTTQQQPNIPTPGPAKSPTVAALLDKRPLLHDYEIGPSLLHPSWLPSLQTLVLTELPKEVRQSSGLVSQLTRYITACSNETYLAKVAVPAYSKKASSSTVQFALRRIILETKSISTSTKVSATEDEDSENLWKAASHDFSFFHDEGVSKSMRCEALPEPLLNPISTLAAFRKARRDEYIQHVRNGGSKYVEGYWDGEITVVNK